MGRTSVLDHERTERTYQPDSTSGKRFRVVNEYQDLDCPHADCGKPFFLRTTHIYIYHTYPQGPAKMEYHNNHKADLEELKALQVMTGVREMQWNCAWFLVNDTPVRCLLSRRQLLSA